MRSVTGHYGTLMKRCGLLRNVTLALRSRYDTARITAGMPGMSPALVTVVPDTAVAKDIPSGIYILQESLANAEVNAQQHCVSAESEPYCHSILFVWYIPVLGPV